MDAREGLRLHEAAHVGAALFVGRSVESVRVDDPAPGIAGLTTTALERELRPEDVVIALIGPMADPKHAGDWPPPWPPRRDSAQRDERSAAIMVERLGLTRDDYAELVEAAEGLLATDAFKRFVFLVSRALAEVEVLDGEDIEILRSAIPQPEGAIP